MQANGLQWNTSNLCLIIKFLDFFMLLIYREIPLIKTTKNKDHSSIKTVCDKPNLFFFTFYRLNPINKNTF